VSEDAWFLAFMFLAFALGALANAAWNAFVRTKQVIKIDVDNSNAIRGFAEAMDIAKRYEVTLDQINVKSVICRKNIEAIPRPRAEDLH
jgi:hypothetical protein